MSAGFLPERLQHRLRALVSPVSEFIHVSAIYLGLAVLTTLGLSLVLPSMRQQSQQLHEVVLAMFQADGAGGYGGTESDNWSPPTDLAEAPDVSAPVAAAPASASNSSATGSSTAGSSAAGTVAQATPPAAAQSAAPAASGAGAQQAPVRPPVAYNARLASASIDFFQALAASMRDQPIPGVTAGQAKGLRSYLSRKYRIASSVAGALARTTFAIGKEFNVDPQLLLAVIAIESRYNPFVESAVGAQGLMQIMGTVHRDKLRASGGPASIFNPVVNIRIGTQILADCIRRRGSIEGGLACYVGASGPSDGGYGASVLAERRRIALASGIPLGKR
ncbi:lytic transglycosylase domain-containing protein [Castellaniella caeni]|uniref:lytic transglycosylase domain-containing protein n=1 Tax=Castellaniella caeni TaxID=266123 RepID=UPI00082A0C7C|nr:lytic transglycosylase domain-containing protein [Castellaniella caeni]